MVRLFSMLFILMLAGCNAFDRKPPFPGIESIDFEKTPERVQEVAAKHKPISVSFNEMPLRRAMEVLASEYGISVACSSDLDNAKVDGSFMDIPVGSVLETLARRCGASVVESGGVWYIGEAKKADRFNSVFRMPPADPEALLEAVRQSLSELGTVSIVGSCVWISDNADSITKALESIEYLRNSLDRRYIAEFYFVRLNENDFITLTADLQINQVDIFASSFNVEQLFSMFVNADLGNGRVSIDQRPVLYLSEGRRVTFEDGSEIVRERRAVSQEGYASTSGYEKFSDGLKLEASVSRVTDLSYSLDFTLSVGVFDKDDKSSIPPMQRSVLTNPGMLVSDGRIHYAGSLRRTDNSRKHALFMLNASNQLDLLTIWVRVREQRAM